MVRLAASMMAILLLASGAGAQRRTVPPVSEAEIRETIAVLASDAFEGRAPGTPGEAKTIAYLAQRFAAAGLSSGARGSRPFLDPVALVRVDRGPERITLVPESGDPVALGRDEAFAATRADLIAIADAPLVFIGYGVDGSGELLPGLAGKVVIMLGAEPPYLGPDHADRRQASRRERDLLQAGAKAVFVLAGSAEAIARGRAFHDFRRVLRWAGDDERWDVRGAIVEAPFAAMLARAGADLAGLKAAAASASFSPEPLPLRINVSQRNRLVPFTSYNIVGKLPGRRSDGRAVVMMAHWDHLGLCAPEGAPDRICNGAVDNASGVAALLAVADRARRLRPDRDIWFVATTAEEQALQGAYAFAADPPLPLESIVAGLNLDTIAVGPRGASVGIVAPKNSVLEPVVRAAATAAGRPWSAAEDARAFVSRQDGWAFVQRGIPFIMAGGSFTDLPRLNAYLRTPYHGPDDELTDALDLGGATDDAELHVDLVRRFASRDFKPPRPAGR